MKLFVVAAFIAVCSAGRLEHLEPSLRGYLPPSPGSSFGQGFGNQGAFGSHGAQGANGAFSGRAAHGSQGAFGGHAAHGSHGGFGANSGSFGGSQAGHPGFNARASFGSPSNQYLPPNHGFAASGSDDSVSVHGFGGQRSSNQQFGQGPSQFGNHGASSHGANHFRAQARFGANPFGAQSRFQPQSSAVSRQYLAPHSTQNNQQQPFNEQTGYQY